jgi:hypothetical protein
MAAEVDPQRRQMMAELAAWHNAWARKWGIDDHPYEGMTIEEWESRIPPEAEADYQRGADAILAAGRGSTPGSRTHPLAGAELPPPPRLGDAPPPPEPPPLARTRDEALFYLQLQPCPRCGQQRTPWSSALVDVGGVLARRYSGTCAQCGLAREYVFRVPDQIPPRPPGATMHYGGDEPSELIDAGQWLLMSETVAEQTRAELAAGEHDAAALHAELAIACATEVIKFVPPGGAQVPDSGFWTPAGRQARDSDPRRFTLRRLLLVLDMLHEEFDAPLGRTTPAFRTGADARPAGQPTDPRDPGNPHDPGNPDDSRDQGSAPPDSAPPDSAPPDSAPPDSAPPDSAPLPIGRTNAEIHLFLELDPCVCGTSTDRWSSQLRQVGSELVAVYTTTCPHCGRARSHTFRLPEQPIPTGPEGARFQYGGQAPSQLLDPGEWLFAADRLARSVPLLEPDADEAARARFRYALGRAAAALAEVTKFAPGSAQVPESACFTERGRAVYRTEPGRFRRDRLAAVRDTYLRLLADAGLS